MLPPTEAESRMALESSRRLLPLFSRMAELGEAADVVVQLQGQPNVEEVRIPLAALRLLRIILDEMAQGNVVTLTPIHAELTTQEAADLINVSRPFLCKLLDEGKIAHRKVGRHRKVKSGDLMDYKRATDFARADALDELAAQAQELGMGY
jgi:excisionase family DNA binding protein